LKKISRRCSRIKDEDLLSIKSFSEVTGITQAALRHYDKVELFHPVKRSENGYRFYSVRQAIAANFINVLNSANIP
jgi:DNA-binding transcriptional MerR regulator